MRKNTTADIPFGRYSFLVAILAGALLTLSFAPFKIFPLAFVSTTLLLLLWQETSAKTAFFRGWLFGVGLFGTGVSWIFVSIYTYGHAPFIFALFLTCLFVAILSIFPALSGYCLNRFFRTPNFTKFVYAFPVMIVFFEWMRSLFFSGFPWLTIGYSQIDSPLRGYAPFFSVYGVSLFTLCCSGLLLATYYAYRAQDRKKVYSYLFSIVTILVVGQVLAMIHWTQPAGPPVKVSLVQGNIPQDIKWSQDQVQNSLNTYTDLTQPHWDSKIIVWPESAIPTSLENAEEFVNALNAEAIEKKVTLITGVPIRVDNTDSYYNAIISLGAEKSFYLKHKLVPFGEYIPFRNWLNKFLDILHISDMSMTMSDFKPSNMKNKPMLADKIKISAFICYEIAFPEMVITHDSTINMLLTVTNDAWFGHSIAQAQHLEMAQMRALELERPLLFVSNDGLTAVINAFGKIQSIAPPHIAYVLTDTVQPMKGTTSWQRRSMDAVLVMMVSFLFLSWRRRNSDPIIHTFTRKS